MNNNDRKNLSEVVEILNHTDKEIKEKIPNSFMDFLYNNMDKEYKPNIDFSKNNWDDNLNADTQAIIALIYREYMVPKEEREKLIKQEKADEVKKEQELMEKYNPDNLFKKKKLNQDSIINDTVNNTKLEKLEKTPWYSKVIRKILNLLKK